MRNPFVHSSVMMRRSAIREVGLYDESLPCVVVRDLWVRIAQRFQLAVLSEVLGLKRLHPQQYFRGQLDEAIRLQTSGAIRMKAARELSLPYHVRLLSLLYACYARLPGKLRNHLKCAALHFTLHLQWYLFFAVRGECKGNQYDPIGRMLR